MLIKNEDKVVIACSKNWFFDSLEYKKLKKKISLLEINNENKLNFNYLTKNKAKIIFFPHWSYKVSEKILKNFHCINFHSAPLPYGRGGSPIQNLIRKKIKKTTVCAIKMTNIFDAGPIYLKKKVSLNGNLDDIFKRISKVIYVMILKLIKKNIKPKKQVGKVVNFKRLKNKDNQINNKIKFKDLYDMIRMVDHHEYDLTKISFKNFTIGFKKARKYKNKIICEAEFKKK